MIPFKKFCIQRIRTLDSGCRRFDPLNLHGVTYWVALANFDDAVNWVRKYIVRAFNRSHDFAPLCPSVIVSIAHEPTALACTPLQSADVNGGLICRSHRGRFNHTSGTETWSSEAFLITICNTISVLNLNMTSQKVFGE